MTSPFRRSQFNPFKLEEIALQLKNFGFSDEEVTLACNCCSSIEGAVQMLSEGLKPSIPTFQCPICCSDFEINEMITLSCSPVSHRFCIDCFSGYCSCKITDAQVNEAVLVCPQVLESGKLCGTSITIHELKANLPEETFLRYETFLTRSTCEAENFRRCPRCNEWFVDITEALEHEAMWKSIQCEKCEHKFCGKCGQKPHKGQKDQNLSCADLAVWIRENDEGEKKFHNMLKEEKIFPCPKCGQAGELRSEAECKFLYCLCKANFCALCGIQLKEPQHFSHFGATGPFGTSCLGPVDRAGVDA